MKRMLFCLIVISLLLVNTVHVFADCQSHDYYTDLETTYTYEFVGSQQAGHLYRVFIYESCINCGNSRKRPNTNYPDKVEPHNYLVLNEDMGHVGITRYHDYKYSCSDSRCSYTQIKRVYCDGTCHSTITVSPIAGEIE